MGDIQNKYGSILFLRHGPKAFSNRKGFEGSKQLDAPLTNNGKIQVENWSNELINAFGLPDAIITSPYCRTRQTAEILSKTCIKCDHIPELYIDSIIGENLSYVNPPPNKNEFYNKTLLFSPIIDNSHDEWLNRIKTYYNDLYIENDKNIVIITHGLFVQRIEQLMGYSGKYPGYFEGFQMFYDGNKWDMKMRIIWK